MPHECIVSAHHAANAGIDLLANAVVAAADVVAIAGDVDVDWTAAADGMMNVIDSYPEVAFHHQAVGTFPERTSSVPVGCKNKHYQSIVVNGENQNIGWKNNRMAPALPLPFWPYTYAEEIYLLPLHYRFRTWRRKNYKPLTQCLVPYFPSRRARTKCKKTRKFDPSIRVAFCRTLFHWKFGSNRNGEKMPPFVPKENSGKNIFG